MKNIYSFKNYIARNQFGKFVVLSLMMGAVVCTGQVRLTVKPNVPSELVMKVQPNTVCELHADGSSAAGPPLTLFADYDGTVRFQVRPLGSPMKPLDSRSTAKLMDS